MKKIMDLFLSFTGKSPSISYRILSMLPGTVVFLIVSPLMLFLVSRILASWIPISFNRSLEVVIVGLAISSALILMSWATASLWIEGRGTPAPITPTEKLVTNGLYSVIRNPIELGTNLYFLALGTWFDSLVTGVLCMLMGLTLGVAYLKVIEEQELRYRFGSSYDEYYAGTPMFLPGFRFGKPERKE